MLRALLSAAMALLIVGALGCGRGVDDTEEGEFQPASMKVVMDFEVDPDFTDNSVKICGERKDEADAKYPCRNWLGTENDHCECFNFRPDGTIVEIKDLCPSINIDDNPGSGTSMWEFTYRIYSGLDCQGEVLNMEGNTKNFECFDADNLWARDTSEAHPNASYDKELKPGCDNFNEVICLTKNASKFFDFDVCVEVLECTDEKGFAIACHPQQFEYDCGCELVEPGDSFTICTDSATCPPQHSYCECDQGLDPAHPPKNCQISPPSCLLICTQ